MHVQYVYPDLEEGVESGVHAFTSGQSLFTHLKEVDKRRVDSEQNIRLSVREITRSVLARGSSVWE